MNYILDGHRPVPEPDLLRWAHWFETADRRVRQDADELTGWYVSTVFLGIDHRFFGGGPPLLFETMVFAPVDPKQPPAFVQEWDNRTIRTATWEDAETAHRAMTLELTEALRQVQP